MLSSLNASDLCVIITTLAQNIIWPVLVCVMFVIQNKARKAGDPPPDFQKLFGELVGTVNTLKGQVGANDKKINDVAMATPAVPVVDGPSKTITTVETIPTPEVH